MAKKPSIKAKKTVKRVKPVATELRRSLTRQEFEVSLVEAMFVPADLLETYKPPAVLKHIVEEMMSGVTDERTIAANIGMAWVDYQVLMKSPFNRGWVSGVLSKQIPHMIGIADVAIWKRACEGNVPAYKAITERFGKMAPSKQVHAHISANMQLEQLSDEQLEKVVEGKMRVVGKSKTEGDDAQGA
jgi:hypothetical protein